MIFNPTTITQAEIDFREDVFHTIFWLESFGFEIAPSMRVMLCYPCFHLLARWLGMMRGVWTKLRAMHSIVLSNCDACCTISYFATCFPAAFSSPTTSLSTFVIVGSAVHFRLDFRWLTVSSSGVSLGGSATGILSMGRSLADKMADSDPGIPTEVEP